ncbi:hypothetical protein E4K65_23535 [Bradyrhizobium niftali]|uniref:Uncharacterized protein n=1 Tax=Bradyrhizobium niftali TaxID=2560055 RepID=A0A4Y9LTL7_9BRAD|nr:hypothetical protein E4K65_23535 [Bradyrhizobium niftali]
MRAQRLVRRSFSEGGSNPESFRGGILDCFAALAMTEYEVWAGSPDNTVIPRLVRTCALGRGIQYAAAPRPNHNCLGILDRPVKAGDDSECVVADMPSRPRGGFRPSFASSLHPPSQEGAGKAGC